MVLTGLQRPRRLVTGDVVRVIAPCGPISPERLSLGAHLLEEWGLQVEIGEHVLDRSSPYLAGTDTARVADLVRAWCDPRVAAVLCARGGYGVHRIIDKIDWAALNAARPGGDAPILVGFSDVTALHEAVGQQLGVVSLLGPMVASMQFLDDEVTQNHLRAVLFGQEQALGPVTGRQPRLIVPGRASGRLVGGTLTVMAAGVGTATGMGAGQHHLDGAILLIEDVAEEPYRIDRMLTQLMRCGALDGLAGVAGGSWTGCGSSEAVDEVLYERLGRLGIPVVNGLDFGHGSRNLTVPLGPVGVLDADHHALWWPTPALA